MILYQRNAEENKHKIVEYSMNSLFIHYLI
jgi:hypothetical protein